MSTAASPIQLRSSRPKPSSHISFRGYKLFKTQLHQLSIGDIIKTEMKNFNLYSKHNIVVDFNIVILICSLMTALLQAETCS